MSAFGEEIRRLREQKGLTQSALARLVKTDAPSISDLELGKRRPRADTVQRLAAALETTAEHLRSLGGIHDPNSPRPHKRTREAMTKLGIASETQIGTIRPSSTEVGEGIDTARSNAERTVLGLVGQVYEKHGDAGMEAALDLLYGLLKRGTPKAGRHSGGGVQRTS